MFRDDFGVCFLHILLSVCKIFLSLVCYHSTLRTWKKVIKTLTCLSICTRTLTISNTTLQIRLQTGYVPKNLTNWIWTHGIEASKVNMCRNVVHLELVAFECIWEVFSIVVVFCQTLLIIWNRRIVGGHKSGGRSWHPICSRD